MSSINTNTTSPSPSTTLTTETSLSTLYKVLRTVIRPIRPHLVKPGKPLPAGSPQLTKHPKSKNHVNIVERKQGDLWVYDFVPQSRLKEEKAKHRILYFAGGGFQSPPSSEHWSFVSQLANDLKDRYEITLVSYPLAPNSPASASLPVLRSYLRDVCEQARIQDAHVSLMGDSAGGNVAISLGFWWTMELTSTSQQDQGSALTPAVEYPPATHLSGVLRNIFAISPACDMRSINPDIAEADRHDPVLNIAMEEQCATAWSGPQDHPGIKHTPKADPSISPILYSEAIFAKMKEVGIKVHGTIGTHDVLAPDAQLFRQKLVSADVPGEWLVWEGQMHCFVLAGVYGMSEGKQGVEWCEGVLIRNV